MDSPKPDQPTVPAVQPTAPVDTTPAPETAAAPGSAKPLTPDEQMAAFEEDQKNNDWGHQPC